MKQKWIREVLNDHEGPLLRYAYRLCSDLELARDAVQDTFLKLCREDRSRIESYLVKWLFTVCRNRVFEILRKEKRMTGMTDLELVQKPVDDESPAAAAEKAEDKVKLKSLMSELPEREQEVLRLKFQNGLSYKEISEITSLSVSNVGFILHKAIKELRGKFNQDARKGGAA